MQQFPDFPSDDITTPSQASQEERALPNSGDNVSVPSLNNFEPDLSMTQDFLDHATINQMVVTSEKPVNIRNFEPSLPQHPSQLHLRLPEGHLPALIDQDRGQRPHVQPSLLSQHVEALELEARIQLDMTSSKGNHEL